MFDHIKNKSGLTPSSNVCKTIVGAGSKMKGEINCKGVSQIAGEVDGNIIGDDRIIVGNDALITGEIIAKEIEIDGEVRGTITAHERIILNETAQVEGDLHAPYVTIEQGAVFNGSSTMPTPKEREKLDDKSESNILPIEPHTDKKENLAS